MDNLEMLINIYNNYLDDTHVGGFPSMRNSCKMEKTLMDENENVIASLGFLELDENNNRV
jgi:hypothetical protein